MTRTMGDSTNYKNIPLDVNIVGVYGNGLYAAEPADVAARFPPNKYVTVWFDVLGNAPGKCQILDVESGDATPARAPGWVKERRGLVKTSLPTLYCNRTTLPVLIYNCALSNLYAAADYQLIVSTLDGTELINGRPLHTVPGVVACQDFGGITAKFDQSIVYDDRWHPLP
jgi:hypothetical protein